MPLLQQALAFKAYEIEELADVYFFRPLGALVAYAAHFFRLTPNQVSIFGGAVGIIAGSLLYFKNLGLLAFALLIVHGIVDSADGQLARMTGQLSGLGRVLDSLGGHATHLAIYIAITAGVLSHGGGGAQIVGWAGCAAFANFVQAQLYDYYRMVYTTVVLEGKVPGNDALNVRTPWAAGLLHLYRITQRKLIGTHADVEAALLRRSAVSLVRDDDRVRYRRYFYGPVRGWNLLGDNTRFYAIGVLAWLHHLDWFFAFILFPMNAALLVLLLWQRQADRRFLFGL